MKYCYKCKEEIPDIKVLECPACGGQSFVHDKKMFELDRRIHSQAAPPIQEDEPAAEQSARLVVENQTSKVPVDSDNFKDILERLTSTEEQIQLLLADSIAAQNRTTRAANRTTHAVRAFVRFLFIQLSAITLAAFLWNFAASGVDPIVCQQSGEKCSPIAGLQIIAVIIWIAGVFWSSSAGWSELQKSEVTER